MRFDIVRLIHYYVKLDVFRSLTADDQQAVLKLIAIVEQYVSGFYAVTLPVRELQAALATPRFEEIFRYAVEVHRGWSRTSWTRLGELLVVVNTSYIEDHDRFYAGVCQTTPEREAELAIHLQKLDEALVALNDTTDVTVMTVDQVASIASLEGDTLAAYDIMKMERTAYTGSGILYLTRDLILVPDALL